MGLLLRAGLGCSLDQCRYGIGSVRESLGYLELAKRFNLSIVHPQHDLTLSLGLAARGESFVTVALIGQSPGQSFTRLHVLFPKEVSTCRSAYTNKRLLSTRIKTLLAFGFGNS
jgi:hypothetical protein